MTSDTKKKGPGRPRKILIEDPSMLSALEEQLRGALEDVKRQRELLRAKQDHVKVYDEDLAKMASQLGRTVSLLEASIRRFEKQDIECARGMSEEQEFELSLEWAESLGAERLAELHRRVGALRKEQRGVLS